MAKEGCLYTLFDSFVPGVAAYHDTLEAEINLENLPKDNQKMIRNHAIGNGIHQAFAPASYAYERDGRSARMGLAVDLFGDIGIVTAGGLAFSVLGPVGLTIALAVALYVRHIGTQVALDSLG